MAVMNQILVFSPGYPLTVSVGMRLGGRIERLVIPQGVCFEMTTTYRLDCVLVCFKIALFSYWIILAAAKGGKLQPELSIGIVRGRNTVPLQLLAWFSFFIFAVIFNNEDRVWHRVPSFCLSAIREEWRNSYQRLGNVNFSEHQLPTYNRCIVG